MTSASDHRRPRSRATRLLNTCVMAALVASVLSVNQTAFSAAKPAATRRVDLQTPVFTNPASITNTLFPISDVVHVVMLGEDEGQAIRVEATLLPGTKTIRWDGKDIQTRVIHYIAYHDGRIAEFALDFYAQDDTGAVWYFGEDVFNYEDGVVVDNDGTWLAGRDGPPGMIMPANPKVGDVYRPENMPGFVFEEVTVKAIDRKVRRGPRGPVKGIVMVDEVHMDGAHEQKGFAPGYGEFVTPHEAVAVATPIDSLGTVVPEELTDLDAEAQELLEATSLKRIDDALDETLDAWEDVEDELNVPPLLEDQIDAFLKALKTAVNDDDLAEARLTAANVAAAVLDLQVQYRATDKIDVRRLETLSARTLLDSEAGAPGNVLGDVAAIETIWKRTLDSLAAADATRIGGLIAELRTAADAANQAQVQTKATQLQTEFANLA